MSRLRHVVKRTIERAIVAGGPASVARRSRVGHVLVLGYHNIAPHGATPVGDRSLHLPRASFARQLDALVETHDVVGLETLLGATPTRDHARPLAVITFDDAYLGAMTAGVEELAARDLPATVFVAPSFLGGASFWWDALAGDDDLAPNTRERALDAARGIDDDVRALAASDGARAAEPPAWARCASEADIAAAVASSRLTVASHTWSHPNLTRLTDAELARELEEPRAWLGRFANRVVPVVSYPYGLADARVQAAARAAGYAAGFMITGGWTSPVFGGRFDVPRLNVPAGLSRDGFVLRAAGILAH